MTILEIAELPKPSKEFKNFCNNLRCPLCDGQLDGNVHPKEAKLYCVNNNAEYRSIWHPNLSGPVSEHMVYWYSQYEYIVNVQRVGNNDFRIHIDRFNSDVIPIYKNSTRKRVFDYQGPRILFFRKRMEEERFLKKLKTYNVFS